MMVLPLKHFLPYLPKYFAENFLRYAAIMTVLWIDSNDLRKRKKHIF